MAAAWSPKAPAPARAAASRSGCRWRSKKPGPRRAHDGLGAVRLAESFRPAVVFMDIGMPGMNGYQAVQAIRRLPGIAQPCLVALTGWGAEHDRARSAAAGFDHHLTKPVELATVQALLAAVAGHIS